MKVPSSFLLPFVLLLGVLSGCGVQNVPTQPVGHVPTPGPSDPYVSSLSPSVVVGGGPAFTLTIMGANFASGDSAYWAGPQGCTITSTFVSSTEVVAQVPAACLIRPGVATVTVEPVNPSPIQFGGQITIQIPPLTGNQSYSLSMTPVQANDMVWDPLSEQFYLSVVVANGTNGNTITALNPSTRQFGISSAAGDIPDRLSLASDGSYLYAGMDGSNLVQRFTLPNLASDISIPLGTDTFFSTPYPYYPMDVAVDPASSHTVAVVRGVAAISPREQGGVVLYDDAVQRPATVPSFSTTTSNLPIDFLAWNPGGNQLYGSYSNVLSVISVDSTGLHVGTIYPAKFEAFGVLHYDAATGYLYADTGQVIDPATGTVIGTFPLSSPQGTLSPSVMIPDDTLHIAYFIGQTANLAGTQQYAIEAFDLTQFTPLGDTSISNVIGVPVKLLRWGTNGLAFLTTTGIGYPPESGNGVYFVQGDFVTSPADRTHGTARDRNSSSAASHN